MTHMAEAEVRAFHDAYLELLRRFGHSHEDAPDGARPIPLRRFALLVDEA